jgi:double-stranded uracil-DNA glycosylase
VEAAEVEAGAASVPADGSIDDVTSDPTISIYDEHAADWTARREARFDDVAAALALRADGSGPVVDLGCGPGWNLEALGSAGTAAIGLDASRGMLAVARERGVERPLVAADLRALPFGRASLAGGWASRSYVHLARADLPMALGDLHRSLSIDAPVVLQLFGGDREHGSDDGDRFAGRRYAHWPEQLLCDVVVGAGFVVDALDVSATGHEPLLTVHARRVVSLPDTVGRGMRLLVCGLNPSPGAAEAGVGFFRAGNRFWPAALAAGLVRRDRDPRAALVGDGVGMTDLVKRTTRRADELSVDEYRAGVERLDRMCRWLEPASVCLVGLAGWRAAVDRRAVAGWQDRRLGDRPVYVMPSTSGLNAATSVDDLVTHLRTAAGGAPS